MNTNYNPEAKSLPVLARVASSKKQQGEYSTTSSFNKRSQTTMPAACQNYTQLKPTNKTSYVSCIWDGGYGRVKIVFHQAPIYLSERLHLYTPSRQLPLFYRHPIVFRIPPFRTKSWDCREKEYACSIFSTGTKHTKYHKKNADFIRTTQKCTFSGQSSLSSNGMTDERNDEK